MSVSGILLALSPEHRYCCVLPSLTENSFGDICGGAASCGWSFSLYSRDSYWLFLHGLTRVVTAARLWPGGITPLAFRSLICPQRNGLRALFFGVPALNHPGGPVARHAAPRGRYPTSAPIQCGRANS